VQFEDFSIWRAFLIVLIRIDVCHPVLKVILANGNDKLTIWRKMNKNDTDRYIWQPLNFFWRKTIHQQTNTKTPESPTCGVKSIKKIKYKISEIFFKGII